MQKFKTVDELVSRLKPEKPDYCIRKKTIQVASKTFQKKFLGKIPINIDLRVAADSGKPLYEKDPNHEISKIFKEIAQKIKESFL